MHGTVAILVVLFVIVGVYAGWHANRSYLANADIKGTKQGRLPAFRRARRRSGLISLATFALLILLIAAVVH